MAAVAELSAPEDATDLVVSDVSMPNMTGTELGVWLAEKRPGMPVVFVSGLAPESLVDLPAPGLSTRLLHKPFDLDALGKAVRELLDGERDASLKSV
jgi:two-component system cell cycle sensor histidine kinase/response regulator CckA